MAEGVAGTQQPVWQKHRQPVLMAEGVAETQQPVWQKHRQPVPMPEGAAETQHSSIYDTLKILHPPSSLLKTLCQETNDDPLLLGAAGAGRLTDNVPK
jgi:hypothetical protein